ncbi:MAG TPA: winged helix-turn-helix transcriptional regulator [Firmicutes bacterium]|nr:winged helix-turn-helix transcriptional regulator [Bacillota bacterium]
MRPPEEAIRALRALGQETRYKIFKLLCSRSLSVEELSRALRISQPAISQHLKVLRQAGLVSIRKQGRLSLCCIDASLVLELVEHLKHLIAGCAGESPC